MSLLGVCQWLASTRGSIALHESRYMYTLVESAHVLTLCVFVGLAAMLDLRLIGATLRRVPVSEVFDRLVPWMTAGFIVMIASGSLLFYAIPVRSYQNIFFRIKVLTLLLAGLNVWIFQRRVYRRVHEWGLDPVPPRSARVAGALSLVLWALIIICGRMIAYNWFDCDLKPRSAFIRWAAGCLTPPR